jgi:transcriptional regulator with XRE-family HTH domain
MMKDTTHEQSPSFEELHTKAEEQLAYWVEGSVLEFTEELTDLMERGHVSRAELAKRTGVTAAYVTKVLGGEGNFTLATMSKLARALKSQLRLHLAPIDTVSEWKDIPLPFARAIAWAPPGGRHAGSEVRRMQQHLIDEAAPKRQATSPESDKHGSLSVAA